MPTEELATTVPQVTHHKTLGELLRENIISMLLAGAISVGGWIAMMQTTVAVQNQKIDVLTEKLHGTASSAEVQQIREDQRQILSRIDSLHSDVQDVYKILVEKNK